MMLPHMYRTTALRREGSAAQRAAHYGYSIIELLAIIAVLMVLTGMLMPVLARSMGRARLIQDGVQIRQQAMLIQMYTENHREIYPIASSNAFSAAMKWYEALIDVGLVEDEATVDPIGTSSAGGRVGVLISVCFVYDPFYMRPGFTLPESDARSSPVRAAQIAYPSRKGMILRMHDGWTDPARGGKWFCCAGRWQVPVVTADMSTYFGDHTAFSHEVPVVIDSIGIPVFSTWGGYRARDF